MIRYEVPIWATVEWEVLRNRFIKRRKQMNLTQAQVSERMGRSRDFVSVLEREHRSTPNLTTVMLWAQALEGTVGVRFPGDQT